VLASPRYWVFWSRAVELPSSWRARLGPGERERAAQFFLDGDRRRYIVGHVLAREVAGVLGGVAIDDVVIDFSCRRCGRPHGRPVVVAPEAELELSISHAGGWVVVAAGRGAAVGVDVETVDRRIGSWFDRVLSEPERADLGGRRPTVTEAVTYWTRKEAVLKLAGVGLATDPAAVCVTPPGTRPRLRRWPPGLELGPPVALHALDAPSGAVASLAVGRGDHPVQEVRLPSDPSRWPATIRAAVEGPSGIAERRRIS
jgi:4'-phosphopantetheinyl transferase